MIKSFHTYTGWKDLWSQMFKVIPENLLSYFPENSAI